MKEVKVDVAILGAGIVGIWLAHLLAKRGHTVGIVEVGGDRRSERKVAIPQIVFPNRRNEGAVRARNQVLTGNSRYWGGGIIRNDSDQLQVMFRESCDPEFLNQMRRAYGAVEATLGVAPAERHRIEGHEEWLLAEVCILTGKRRNVAEAMLPGLMANAKAHVCCNASITKIEYSAENLVSAIEFVDAKHGVVRFVSQRYVLAMGVVDTNLFVQKHLMRTFRQDLQVVGTRLHDHWSVPIARCKWRKPFPDDWLFPIEFRGGHIVRKRVELAVSCPWGTQFGFTHVQARYGEIEPYATLKMLLEARQEGKSVAEVVSRGARLARHWPALIKVVLERWNNKRLYVAEGVELEVVLDFESFPHRENRIELRNDNAYLYWDIRDEDVDIFAKLVRKVLPLIEEWAKQYGLRFELLAGSLGRSGLFDYLNSRSVDAFHLGGGLSSWGDAGVWSWGAGVQGQGNRNLAVIGTAAFRRPGIASPVETLLAMCNIYAASVL